MGRDQIHHWTVEDCHVRTTTEAYGRLSQAEVAKAEVDPWKASGWGMMGKYVAVPCRFGGGRFFFICPGCGRRVFKLYAPPPGDAYACRICHDLTYEARKQTPGVLATLGRDLRVHEELAWRARRRGRKSKRFYRLLAEAQAVEVSLRAGAKLLDGEDHPVAS